MSGQYNPNITNYQVGDVVKVGSGFVDWEVVGRRLDGRIVLRSGLTGRRHVERPENLRAWKPDA